MKDLPPLDSTVRIVSIGLPVWPEAEKFFGADCTLCAVFMTGDTQMVAVEHQADGVCCCFRADMVRTPEQIASDEQKAAITEMMLRFALPYAEIAWEPLFIQMYDAGYRKQPVS